MMRKEKRRFDGGLLLIRDRLGIQPGPNTGKLRFSADLVTGDRYIENELSGDSSWNRIVEINPGIWREDDD